MIVPAFRAALVAATLVALSPGGIVKGAAAQESFLSTIEDLPLMPGLTEDADRGVVFEAPSGRIVESFAAGNASREQVLEFYAKALPQLGWRQDEGARFVREDEVLVLEFSTAGPKLTVRFALAPAEAAEAPARPRQ
jgi:hypothetical protein